MSKTLDSIYNDTCRAYGKPVNDSQCDSWHEVLGKYLPGDVAEAVKRWQGDDTINAFTRRVQGAFMPLPAELKQLVRQIEARRTAANTATFINCTDQMCSSGWHIRVVNGESEAFPCSRYALWKASRHSRS